MIRVELRPLRPDEPEPPPFQTRRQPVDRVEREAVDVERVLADHASAAQHLDHLALVGRQVLADRVQRLLGHVAVVCQPDVEPVQLGEQRLLFLGRHVRERLEAEVEHLGDLHAWHGPAGVVDVDAALDN